MTDKISEFIRVQSCRLEECAKLLQDRENHSGHGAVIALCGDAERTIKKIHDAILFGELPPDRSR